MTEPGAGAQAGSIMFRVVVLLSLSLGCSGAVASIDGGPATDADATDATVADSSVIDGDAGDGTADGAVPVDAGLDGAPTADAGVVPACVGSAPTCYGRDALGCSVGLGCTSSFRCIGFAARCIEQGTEVDCGSVAGCAWNAATDRCGGAQRACATYDEVASCEAQPGCIEGAVCTGTITPCSALDEAACGSQIGCAWGAVPAT